MTPRDMVCVSTNYWGGEWFRKQHFMSRFARDGHRVLFVEPSHSMIRSGGGRTYVNNRHFRSGLERVDERLWILTPRTMLPFVSNPAVSQLNARLIAGQIAAAASSLALHDVCLWNYAVEFAPAVSGVRHANMVSDLVDDLVAYEVRPERATYVRRCTERLVREADLCVYTTEGLRTTYPGTGRSIVVANGYDESLFRAGVGVAPELQGKRRIVGFVGTLFRHLDFDLFAAVASRVSDVTLVLVGRVAGTDREMERLEALGNVRHVGAVPRERVPEFIAGFDVCLVPFKSDAVARNVSPLKAYEYLAMGKPVVSVPIPSLQSDPVSKDVVFAAGDDAFADAVSAALAAAPPGRSAGIDSASWEARYAAVRDAASALLSLDAEAVS